ncbi:ubiquitin-like domain-containing protein CIP73 isoform X1 [Pistacia vera]|uniref:ubiquitin-like domain-containing protein CIP73 isoform X1 n=1 Tax=Pistacia vera TaxID=55513 RepID=UPI001263BF82|nr:ubiquitin-like domain-containing protein CIP73 isoform X1 [Pistacia vera]
MADQHLSEGPSTSNVSGESSDSMVEINIKTLDSQIYSFQVDKNMPVSSFKEKLANDIGVPVGQQRLIFRGKVLKDDHPLSEYHVENGHTLHLVVRQPTQSQPSSDTSSGETNGNSGNRGNDVNAGVPRNRVGQISHSVVLGTFNVGDQGEGIVPDLSRVIGAVMNSLGVGGQSSNNGSNNGVQFSGLSNTLGQPPQGNETDGIRGNVGNQSQLGSQSGQASGQPFLSSPQVVQIPLTAAAVPIPSLHTPIPDSLNTLSEFMNCMEQTLSQNGYQPNTSSTSDEGIPRVELPSNGRGLPTPEALSIILRHAQRLLSGHTTAALSHIAGRLEQEGASSDPTIRGQIQAESAQVGLAMQHLGSLLLELGRVILTLRMGQSPAESSVNAGPAVYISPSGPNPIMVQPFPLQTSSLFGGSAPSNTPSLGPVGVGNAPRNINIHIHAGTALAPVVSAVGTRGSNGDGVQGERSNNTGSADSSGPVPLRMLPVRNVIAAAVPSRPAGIAISTGTQPGLGFSVSPQPANSVLLSSVINEVNSQIRNLVGNMQGENQVSSGEGESTVQNVSGGNNTGNDVGNEQPHSMPVNRVGELSVSQAGVIPESEGQKVQPECHQVRNNEDAWSVLITKDGPTCSAEGSSSSLNEVKLEDTSENASGSSEKQCLPEGAETVPLGLGLGGLERKVKRFKPSKTPVKSGDGGTSSAPLDQNTSRALGQQLLRSLAPSSSGMSRTDTNDPSSGQLPLVGRIKESGQLGGKDTDGQLDTSSTDGQLDTSSAMSQVLSSPEINGLLSGFSEETGVGSPDVLRNMLQQLTQSPQIMSTVNQIAQQIDGQDLGNMFSGLVGGQGGGIDLSRMVQQMMPVVSEALGRGSAAHQPLSTAQHGERSTGVDNSDNQNFEIGIQQVAQRIEHCDPPEEVFRAVVENASVLQQNGAIPGDLVDELCSDEGLAHEYIEILRQDIHQRLQGDSCRDKC